MTKRRILKKFVNNVTGELFTECIVCSKFVPGTDKDKANELMVKIIKANSEFISRISYTEPGNVKGFYRKFQEDFAKTVDGLINEVGALNTNK
jgi:hypothetical protein